MSARVEVTERKGRGKGKILHENIIKKHRLPNLIRIFLLRSLLMSFDLLRGTLQNQNIPIQFLKPGGGVIIRFELAPLLERPFRGIGEVSRLMIICLELIGMVGEGVKRSPVVGVLGFWFEGRDGFPELIRSRSIVISFIVIGCCPLALNHGQ